MARKLVRIATLNDAKRSFYKPNLYTATWWCSKELLKHNRISIDGLAHFLLHSCSKITYSSGKIEYEYSDAIKDPFSFVGREDTRNYSEGMEKLKEMAKTYLSHPSKYKAPFVVLTYPQAYDKVIGVFEDLGCRVKRIEREQ